MVLVVDAYLRHHQVSNFGLVVGLWHRDAEDFSCLYRDAQVSNFGAAADQWHRDARDFSCLYRDAESAYEDNGDILETGC